MLVDVFAPEFRDQKNLHLKNFYMILPPLVSETLLSLGNSYLAWATATKLFVKKPKHLKNLQRSIEKEKWWKKSLFSIIEIFLPWGRKSFLEKKYCAINFCGNFLNYPPPFVTLPRSFFVIHKNNSWKIQFLKIFVWLLYSQKFTRQN